MKKSIGLSIHQPQKEQTPTPYIGSVCEQNWQSKDDNFEAIRQQARDLVHRHQKDVWIYKYGLTYNFRFGRYTKKELEETKAEFVMVVFAQDGMIFESNNPYTNRWCDCKDSDPNDWSFFENNECKCGCKKHHYHHTKCGKITQVG